MKQIKLNRIFFILYNYKQYYFYLLENKAGHNT